jgi:tetrahydromethanopterin S-methyltransferase subunit B
MMRTLTAMYAKLRSLPVAGKLLAGSVGSIEIGAVVGAGVVVVVAIVVVVVVTGTGINAAIHT